MSKVRAKKKIKSYVLSLRKFRVFHRWVGTTLALFLGLSALTGILLSLKKDVAVLQPPTQRGVSKELADWQPLDQLAKLSQAALAQAHPDQASNPIQRIDARPSKGVVKVLFKNGFWEVQLDGQSGEVLSIAKRHSDWIEALHDLSIINDWVKLISMNVLGWGVLFLIFTGIWLWYGPKLLRTWKKRR